MPLTTAASGNENHAAKGSDKIVWQTVFSPSNRPSRTWLGRAEIEGE